MNKNFGRSKILSNKKLLKNVHSKLKKRWSPEQISIFLKHNFPHNKAMNVSHETIYFYIYLHSKSHLKKELIDSLRQKKKTREPARSKESKHIKIKDRISIDERPQEVIGREIPVHWEGDLIIGKDHKSAIVTLVERSIRAVNLVHLKDKSAETVRKAFERNFRSCQSL
ncbi:IS30 family transposase [Empedobacter falsenii]